MKTLALVLLTLASMTATKASAADRTYGAVGPKPNVECTSLVDGQKRQLVNAYPNTANPSNVVMVFGDTDHWIDTHFHNATEARWFLQFLEQTKLPWSVTYKGAFKQSNVLVERFIVTAVGKEDITIQIDRSTDDVVIDCPQSSLMQVVGLSPMAPANLDEFIDIFRFKLEKRGIWFGDEGRRDKSKSKDMVNCG